MACLRELGATWVMGAEMRPTNSPISGMPLAVLEGPTTGVLARSAMGLAAKACWDKVGPMMATTLSRLSRFWKALTAPASSPAVSWKTRAIFVPFTPPAAFKRSSASFAPLTCSWPKSATLLVWATAMPMGMGAATLSARVG